MNGIDLKNFSSCIPGAKVVEPEEEYFYASDFFNDIRKSYQNIADILFCPFLKVYATIEKDGKRYKVSRFFTKQSSSCTYLRKCKYSDGKVNYSSNKQWCFSFENKEDNSQFSLSFIWDSSYIKGYENAEGARKAFIEGVVIAVCDYEVWKTENFRLYAKDDYVADDKTDYGVALLNDVRSVLKDKLIIKLYDKFMPTAELKPRKEVSFAAKYRFFWWKNFFRRLYLCCGGWVFILLYSLGCLIMDSVENVGISCREAEKKAKRKRKSREAWGK